MNTLAVPSPLVSAMDAEESIPLLVCAGQPGVGVPSDSWKAYALPLRDPTTTELPAPSRTPGVGDDSRKVAPGMTCSHTRVGLGAAAAAGPATGPPATTPTVTADARVATAASGGARRRVRARAWFNAVCTGASGIPTNPAVPDYASPRRALAQGFLNAGRGPLPARCRACPPWHPGSTWPPPARRPPTALT